MWCRILLVDDEPLVLQALRRELLRKPDIGHDGMEIEGFTSSSAALARLGEPGADFDIVIADCHMPELDGISFLAEVRNRQPRALRILLTGAADIDGAIQAINTAQVDFLIAKPWSEYDLKGRIALALHQRESRRSRASPLMLSTSRPYRLLLVDDEPAVLAALERELTLGGKAPAGLLPRFSIERHTSPIDALTAAARACPDLVISDYAMPEMDGITLLYRLRGLCPATARILLSGKAGLEVLIDAINVAGVYHFIGKPWDAWELKAAVAQALLYREVPADDTI